MTCGGNGGGGGGAAETGVNGRSLLTFGDCLLYGGCLLDSGCPLASWTPIPISVPMGKLILAKRHFRNHKEIVRNVS